jgi:hypothetical protein
MRDDRVDSGLNATLDTGSVIFKILFAIFVPGPTTPLVPGIEVITKLDVAHPAPQYEWPSCLRLHHSNYSVNIMGRAGLFRTKPKLSAKVLIRVATLPEFARHSSHKANNNFLHSSMALELE